MLRILCPQFSLPILAFCFVPLTILFFKVIFCALYVVSRIPTRLEEWWGVQFTLLCPSFTWGNSHETSRTAPD